MRGSQWLAGVEAKISVAPVQGPSLVSGGVAQSGDQKARPFWPEVLTPGGAPLDDREMSWGDLAFDTDLVAGMLGHPHGAPPLHLCDVQLGQCRTIEPSALQLLAKELCCGTWSASVASVCGRQRTRLREHQFRGAVLVAGRTCRCREQRRERPARRHVHHVYRPDRPRARTKPVGRPRSRCVAGWPYGRIGCNGSIQVRPWARPRVVDHRLTSMVVAHPCSSRADGLRGAGVGCGLSIGCRRREHHRGVLVDPQLHQSLQIAQLQG